jgi:Na+-driven multidrug efflux pump
MSLNLFLRASSLNVALILATRQAAALGKETAAAHAIAINVWLFTAFFIDGYGAAGNILGGKLLGEKNYPALYKLTKRVNLYNLGVACILFLFGALFYSQVGVIFNKDPLVLEIFAGIFYLLLISLPFNSLAFTMDSIFKGLGEMAYLRNLLLGATFFVFIPVILLSYYLDAGLTGVWIALIAWVAYRGIVLVIKFRNKYLPLARKV